LFIEVVTYTTMAKKILVIEDDKDIRESIAYALEEESYEVISSENAKILRSVNELAPDIILLDNWLTEWKSDANGEQLSRGLKSDPTTSHIPVIIISAVSNIKEIAEAGLADDYLRKPFGLTELTDLVKKHIKQ
jgi:two-component system phosphate regulon response regulator PhoB